METLKNLCSHIGAGYLFSIAHFYLILDYLSSVKKPVGRYILGKKIGLGQGSIRTVLRRLSEAGLISTYKKRGSQITEKGSVLLSELKKYIIEIEELNDAEQLTMYPFNYGFQIRNFLNMVGTGIKLRDEAIKFGAKCITSLLFKNDNFIILGVDEFNIKRDFNKLYNELKQKFETIRNNDLIIISAAENKNIAKISLLSAIILLIIS
ncbi:MAG: DUF4443 domain-containing protein [Candidatus Helarchaeota archaeon]